MQQKKMLKVGLQISIQMHSVLGGSKSERLIAFNESDTYIITPPPKQFLSFRKIVLKPAKAKSLSKIFALKMRLSET